LIGLFKKPEEMKPRKSGCICHVIQMNGFGEMIINIEFGLHNAPIQIRFGIIFGRIHGGA
jgi:hypothetical protein